MKEYSWLKKAWNIPVPRDPCSVTCLCWNVQDAEISLYEKSPWARMSAEGTRPTGLSMVPRGVIKLLMKPGNYLVHNIYCCLQVLLQDCTLALVNKTSFIPLFIQTSEMAGFSKYEDQVYFSFCSLFWTSRFRGSRPTPNPLVASVWRKPLFWFRSNTETQTQIGR